jgi:small-conductance mechanosensitive channel
VEETVLTLGLDTAERYWLALGAASPRLAGALLLLLLTWGFARLASFAIGRAGPRVFRRSALVEVLQMLAGALIWIGGILVAATIIFPSVRPQDLLAALGLGSVAIGFAFKDIFENFFAGILILFREPFRIGDHIHCDDVEGAVERIEVRETRVRRTDGQLIVVPNSSVFKKPVTVRTNQQFRRTSIICGVDYEADADRARDVILEAVRHVDSVRDDVRDVQVFACAFGASSVDFEVAWWTGSLPVDIRASRDEVVRAVKRALDREGITIPFPQRTVTFRNAIPSDDGEGGG